MEEMRVVVAAKDEEGAEWVTHVLSQAGYTVALVPDIAPSSPELRGAELLIADRDAAAAVGDAGPRCRILLASRGGTIEMSDLERGFVDVIAFPSETEEVLGRVEHAVRRPA
jgi:DNA-binding response OmpR family regulator